MTTEIITYRQLVKNYVTIGGSNDGFTVADEIRNLCQQAKCKADLRYLSEKLWLHSLGKPAEVEQVMEKASRAIIDALFAGKFDHLPESDFELF